MLNFRQSHHIALLDFQRAVFENMSINLQPFQLLSSHVKSFFAFSAIFSWADGLSSPSGDAKKQRQEDPCSKTDALEHGQALFLMNEALLYQ